MFLNSHHLIRNKSWFALLLAVLFVAVLMIIISSIYSVYMTSKTSVELAYTELQATDLAIEWIEMMKWYMLTQTNKDRQDGYKNSVFPLSGIYTVTYSASNGYEVTQAYSPESIIIDDPVYQEFKRTITVSTISPDEKNITSEVEFRWKKTIQLTLNHVNFYGK